MYNQSFFAVLLVSIFFFLSSSFLQIIGLSLNLFANILLGFANKSSGFPYYLTRPLYMQIILSESAAVSASAVIVIIVVYIRS